ncbi:MAG: polysaccharide deacetylase family protein [Actinobacteria bacterium]|uniref:Unannotated protein n=1 Tax=freshwater metagenome TaxID=449393 RepID=A0A6J7ELS0_9ZZZZ|nr:polysaccharide deacetylase family protein [Actinomycetota bacterium]
MTYDPDQLKARRKDSREETSRSRLTLITVLLLAIAGVGIALVAQSRSSTTSAAVTAQPASAGTQQTASAAETTAAVQTAPDWTKPLSTPAQEAAAVARLAGIGKPIYCAGGHKGRYVALTFDDGPGAYTHFAIRKLKKWKARATFFVVGERLKEPAWKAWAKRENFLAATANHSWSHPYLPGLDLASARRQIADTTSLAEEVTGTKVQVFRPPYGARNAAIDSIISQLGLAEIIWDIDSLDSQGANYAGIAKNVIAGLKPGGIILMHENRGQTIRALPYILPELAKKHLTAVTVPELLALDPPSDAQLAAGPNGCGNLRGHGSPTS